MTINTKKYSAILTGAFLMATPIQGATDREKALVTRYVTMMVYSLKEIQEEKRAKFRQEPMILGCIAYYYYRESDPVFAEQLRGFAAKLLRLCGTTIEAEFPLFEKLLQIENDAIIVFEIWGFDTEMARKIANDAQMDRLKEFKVWMEAASDKNNSSEQAAPSNR